MISEPSPLVPHSVVPREEWLAARRALLAKEKALTRLGDEISRLRRELPWVRVEKPYLFEGPRGLETLADLFEGRSQLVVYHFMYGPGWEEGCSGCSFLADHIDGANLHLAHHDVTLLAVSRAPYADFQAFKRRMGWRFKWVSSYGSDFNFDYHASFTKESISRGENSYNFEPRDRDTEGEAPGISVFYRDENGDVYHTYSAYARGGDLLIGAHNYLDLTPKGRNESETMGWMRLHDEYEGVLPSLGGLAPDRLARMRDVMAGYVQRGDVPGVVTAVSRRGEIHIEALGTQAYEGDAPMRRDTLFRIASLTKPVAAVAAMILVEECRLRLDDPVDPFLPELADRRVLRSLDADLDDTVPAHRPITLRDLLTLRMGLGYIMEPVDYPILRAVAEQGVLQGPPTPATSPSPDEWMRRVGSLPLMFQPGERWMYDLGMDVLGVLIARAADQPLETFLRERIFSPLGMKDTSFSVPPEKIHRLAPAYTTNPVTGERAVFDPSEGGAWSQPPRFPSAGGGLVSTADDYLAFGQMMLNGGRFGEARILSRPSVEAMTVDQLTPDQRADARLFLGPNRSWGLGMAVVTERDGVAAVPGRFGWDGGFGTSWSSDPREGLVGVLLTQQLWTSPQPPPIWLDFWTLAYQSISD
jgi:predicted dithiol-disulfide oxidoreductase (DUF899 family)